MHRLPGSRVASHRMRSLAQFWIMLYWIVRICVCATLHRASVFFFCLLCRPLFPGRCSGARVRLCAFGLPKRFFVSRTCVWSAIVSTQGPPPTAHQPAYEAGSVCCVCVLVCIKIAERLSAPNWKTRPSDFQGQNMQCTINGHIPTRLALQKSSKLTKCIFATY